MTRLRTHPLPVAARLATIGGSLGILTGAIQTTIGSHITDWTGSKDRPVALGLLTIMLSLSVVAAARSLRSIAGPRPETLAAIAIWLIVVALLCSTTVGRIWSIPGALLLAAAGFTIAGCGWRNFCVVVATNWLHGLLGVLGGFEVLMAVSAAPASTIAAGLVAGGALITAAILTSPGKRTIVVLLVVASLPFVALTWWTIVTPLVTIAALVIGLATTASAARSDTPARRTPRQSKVSH